jgi:Transposase DDE domain
MEASMSDTHRRYRAIKRTLMQTLPARPNSHHEKALNTLAALICGIVGAQHTQLPKIASKAPSHGAKLTSRVKRFSRFLEHEQITYETFFLPFAQALLASLAQQPLVLIMDGSSAGRGCLTLLLSVVYGHRALPLAWIVVKGKKGHFPEATHCALLAQVEPYLPADATVIFLGDGEFDGTDLQATIQSYGWQYVCRTASTILIWCGETRIPFTALGVQPDEIVMVADVRVTLARYGPVLALAVWEPAYPHPLYLVSNLCDAESAVEWYRHRGQIESFFSDQKSRGFRIDKSHLADPLRLARLLLAACLAYLWMIYLGALARRDGWERIIHRTDRCDWSLFQLGLHLLDHWLNEALPIKVAFCPPPPLSAVT